MHLIIIVFLLGLTTQNVFTQVTERCGTQPLTEGRKYIVAFPQVWAEPSEKPMNPAMMLFVSSRTHARVRLQAPAVINTAPRIDREFLLEPDEVLQVPITTAYMNFESETRRGFSILLTGSNPFSVSTYMSWFGNGELAMQLPTEAWGTKYRTMNFYQDHFGSSSNTNYRPSQILIISQSDNTVVSFTPTVDTEGGANNASVGKGQTQTVTLQRCETFLIKAKIDTLQSKSFATDLSGTKITSSKPIGVISGHTKGAIMRYPNYIPPTSYLPVSHFVRNNVHDAMLPYELAGTQFIPVTCMYTPTRVTGKDLSMVGIDDDRGDVIRILALHDSTLIRSSRRDGSGLMNIAIRHAGQSYLDTVYEEVRMYVTSKPAMCGQYGKSYAKVLPPSIEKEGESLEGHPTVEAGMPMLQMVPPLDRFVSSGVFKSPEGMDNFLNLVFKYDDRNSIWIDNHYTVGSITNGSIRLINGTDYAYVRTPIGQGDHVVRSENDSIKWMGWTYGSLDGLQQGRAYGTPIAIDLSVPCNDSVVVTESVSCGDVIAFAEVRSADTTCGSLFAIYADTSNNYELTIASESVNLTDTTSFFLKVRDKSQDAYAVVRVVSRSGKFVEKTYKYIADKISWNTPVLDWGMIPLNTPVSKTFLLTNESTDRPLTVSSITAPHCPAVFTISPVSFTMPPGGSQEIRITAMVVDRSCNMDTAVILTPCFSKKSVVLRFLAQQPIINVTDVSWKVPPGNVWYPKYFEIQNTSVDELVVDSLYQYFSNSLNFRIDSGLTILPIVINGGESHKVYVSFNPVSIPYGATLTNGIVFVSNADIEDSVCLLRGTVDSTTTNISEQLTPSISISPQPVILSQHSHINILTPGSYTQLIIINSLGQEIVRMNVQEGAMQLPTSLIPSAGLYLICLRGAGTDLVVPLMCAD